MHNHQPTAATRAHNPLIRLVAGASILAICAGSAAAQERDNAIDEIVVTATRVATPLSKVPLSISAYTQETMDAKGIRDIRDLAQQTPGLDLSQAANTSSGYRISIRGIDSTAGAATTATYIDDTPMQSRNSALNYMLNTFPQIFDLERVEVLRGPQGTLFGASAQGGAVRFITPAPSLTTYSGYARAMYSVTEGGGPNYELGAAVGGPIVQDKLGFRVSAAYKHFGGYVDRISWQYPSNRDADSNTDDTSVVRAALAFAPTENVTITPSIFYQNRKVGDGSFFWLNRSNVDDGRFINGFGTSQPESDHFFLPSLKIVADAGAVTFTSVTARYNRVARGARDSTNGNDRLYFGSQYLYPRLPGWPEVFSVMFMDIRQKDFTQEFRVNNSDPDARLRWQAGLYYSAGTLKSNPMLETRHLDALFLYVTGRTTTENLGSPNIDNLYNYIGDEHTKERSLAGYVNVDFEVIDRLTLTVGLRQSKDKLDFDVVEYGPDYGVAGQTGASGQLKGSPLTPRVALRFQADEYNMYYASYAKGYRTGGVNKGIPNTCNADLATLGIAAPKTYEPDTTQSYELGAKNRFFDNRLQVDAAVFYTKWKNIQQQIRLPCSYSIVGNTGQAVSKGFDLSANFRVTDSLELSAAVGYNDAYYTNTLLVGTAPLVFEGQTLGATPWTLNLAADYRFTLMNDAESYLRVQYGYKQQNDGPFPWQNPVSSQYDNTRFLGESIRQLDVRLGTEFRGVDITLFAENALNEAPLLDPAPIARRQPLQIGRTLRPRTLGVMLTSNF